MLEKYIRIYVLLPIKPQTLALLGSILMMLTETFGGVSYMESSMPQAKGIIYGIWNDNGNAVRDRLILLWVDVEESKTGYIDEYFSDFKATYEKRLGEKQLWITVQPIARIA